MNLPDVVTQEEWLAARKALLVKEKELTRAQDYPAISAFLRDRGHGFPIYSTFARGLEQPGGTTTTTWI